MDSLLNHNRPPVFCPGCSHERIIRALDKALVSLELTGSQVVIVSDIGCSGLFDTFFNTHAMHGLHGRALTYATGIKLVRPELKVIVTMGDGGLGIGGTHVMSTCRRNIDLTLLVLNNFNYGMTGGQCSATTPIKAKVESSFLNSLEQPLDICQVAGVCGAGFVVRTSAYADDLSTIMVNAVKYEGFSLLDIRGICTGRYTRRNKITPKSIALELNCLPSLKPFIQNKSRQEYGRAYRDAAAKLNPVLPPKSVVPIHIAPCNSRKEILILGAAGQRIITAGELLCLAGTTAGLHATQKNDYPITIMEGHSISEVILSKKSIGFTGINRPSIVVAVGQEGVERRKKIFNCLSKNSQVVAAAGVDLPTCEAMMESVDFKTLKIKSSDWALAALAWLAASNHILSLDMLLSALKIKFKDPVLKNTLKLVNLVKTAKGC
jgi:pyruvate/2-oxoacid:ferredoxin oxidoreductase beta subunit/Pyruvate/2-oxoacid:ferredoxin oxidoreductase gamma subunit